ncbi:enoyl-CoA hydratase/isomerase family protein [Novosphingopyxis sp.]|uniref:enoyl-CoA hydratase/isomerase family protein n=1 Tax=Novosphingopyxis sp. TaxID=2709690 RepID=UPI003B5CD294
MTQRRVVEEREDGLAILTLSGTGRGNVLDAQCTIELRELAMRYSLDDTVRAVLLRTDGRDFCFGGDLSMMGESDDIAWTIRSTVVDYHLAVSHFAAMNAPLIIAVNGAAAGAGLALAALGDYVYAGEGAKFAFAYDAVGLCGDGGVSWTLTRLIGMRNFRNLVFEGKSLSATQAYEIGLVSKVVPNDMLQDAALGHARRLATGPTLAYGAIKRLANASYQADFATQLETEARTVSELSRSDDAQQAMAAVLRGEAPSFNGS